MQSVLRLAPFLLMISLTGCDIGGMVIEAQRHQAGTRMRDIMAATDQCDDAIDAEGGPDDVAGTAHASTVCQQAYGKYPNASIVQVAYGIETIQRGGKSGHGDPDIHSAGVRLLTEGIATIDTRDDAFYMAVEAAGGTNHLVDVLVFVNACKALANYHWPNDPECNRSQVAEYQYMLSRRNEESLAEYHQLQAGYIPEFVPTGGPDSAADLGIELGEHEQLMHGYGE